jgi:exodeoxyribonuclease VII large subunit
MACRFNTGSHYSWSHQVAEVVAPIPTGTLRVGDLTRYLKYLVDHDELLGALSVIGEISDLTRAPSGHVYFTMKDAASQISCVLFRREAAQQPEQARELRKGMSVVVHGCLTVYEPRGTYQIFVERVLPQGEGESSLRFHQLKTRLEAEGLFAVERKRPLPSFPRKLALVTSLGSQAYHDVLHRLSIQYPTVSVIEVGVSVQGDGAHDEMVMALDIVNRLTDADVILLVRGGGAPEDLHAFNEERLARAIFASRIPVVTGVGHETDHTIVDFVADVRAATPSLAAASAVPDLRELVRRSAQLHRASTDTMMQRLHFARNRWIEMNQGLIRASPQARVSRQRRRSAELRAGMQQGIEVQLRLKRARLQSLQAHLVALDPLAILSRGYAVLIDSETGTTVSQVRQAVPGSLLRARVTDGEFSVRVEA